jgi:hypothetical protein
MSMRLIEDRNAQLSIDFLVGVTIFLLAFIYQFAAIPSMFVPFQSNSDELTMMADRVGMILVEDTLAERSSTGQAQPGIINGSKVNSLDLDDSSTKKALGLSGDYHIQIVLQKYDNRSGLDAITEQIIPNDPDNYPGNQNVGQSRRFVYYRDPTASHSDPKNVDPAYYPGLPTFLVVRIW